MKRLFDFFRKTLASSDGVENDPRIKAMIEEQDKQLALLSKKFDKVRRLREQNRSH